MAIQVNQEVPQEAADRVLLTGVANLGVVALNPDKAELEALGRKPKEEPVYKGKNKKSGVDQMQLDIYLGGEVTLLGGRDVAKVLTKVSFWVENSTSRGVYMDNFAKFGKDKSKLDAATARLAYNGEVDLVQFLKALCNVKPTEQISLDTIAEIAQGNIAELRDTFDVTYKQANQVQVLLGVKEQKYQDVFTRQFDYAGRQNNAYLHKQLIKQLDYERQNSVSSAYYGPINVLDETYVPSAYLARPYSPEAQEKFQSTMPKGTFGAPGGFPGAAAPAAPGANQPFSTEGQFPQPRFAAQPMQQLQPVGAGVGDDSDDLPF